jgi:hypothetical protein
MSRFGPDLTNKLQNYIASGMALFGQPVTLRKYISASAGNPELGIEDRLCYQNRPTQMELRLLSLEELQMIGGQDLRGTFETISIDPITRRDEVIYNGELYQFISEPEQEVIGARIYSKGFMARASITGYF